MTRRDAPRQCGVAFAPGSDALLLGVDFTCAPSRRKPITVAWGRWRQTDQRGRPRDQRRLELLGIECLTTLAAFETLLARPGPWLGAFDFPFGLPRVFVESQRLGDTLADVVAALRQRCATRMDFRALVDAWGNRRPAGQRLVHRATDTAEPGAFTTSPLQTRYVPVGFMFFEGLPRLLAAGVSLPGLAAGDPQRIALEGYPGLVAHDLIGTRSYKNRDSDDRRAARLAIVEALEAGRGRFATTLRLGDDARRELLDDASGDRLDAVLCLVQAAWAWRTPGHGLPEPVDPVEGWVTGARWGAGRVRC